MNEEQLKEYLAQLEYALNANTAERSKLLERVRGTAVAGDPTVQTDESTYANLQEQQAQLKARAEQLQQAKMQALAQLQQRAALLRKPQPPREYPNSPAQYYPTGEDLLPLAERIKRSQANSPSMTESPWEAPHASRTEAWKAGLDPRLGAGYMLTTPNLLYDLAEGAVDMVKGTRSPSRWGQAAGALSQAMGGPGTDRFASPYDKHESAAMLLNPAFYARGAYNKASRTLGPKLRDAYFNMRYPHHENVYNPSPVGALGNLRRAALPAPQPTMANGAGPMARSQREYFDQELPRLNKILDEIMSGATQRKKPAFNSLSPDGAWVDDTELLPFAGGGSV